MAVSAVILAGGKGRRMGGVNKALLPWGDGVLLDTQLKAAAEWTEDIVVVSNDDSLKSRLSGEGSCVRVVPDLFAGEGPLAGLHAGLKAARYEVVWLLACDQPFLSLEAASLLLEQLERGAFQAALPVIGGRPQPLHAVYRKVLADQAEALLLRGERRFVSLLERIHWCGLQEQEFMDRGISIRFTDDVDTPEQYKLARVSIREN